MIDELISTLIDNGVFLTLEGDTLKVKYNGNSMSDELLHTLRSKKPELLDYLKREKERSDYKDIVKLSGNGPFELSSAQHRLWILNQFEENRLIFNIPTSVYLNQEIDIECFKKAVKATIVRHEILRTIFKPDESGEIKQWVLDIDDLGFEIEYLDFREEESGAVSVQIQNIVGRRGDTKVETQKEYLIQDYIDKDSKIPFDLENGPMFRAALLQVENQEYLFYFSMHHIVSDGWSMEVLNKDVFALYEAFRLNKKPSLTDLRIQYKDYSAWQLDLLNQDFFKSHKNFWLNSLSGEISPIQLPSTKKRPKYKTYNGHCLSATIGSKSTGELKNHAQSNGGSLFVALLSVWNVLIYRYTSIKDIVVGTPVAGREHADLKDQIGFYVNTLALRNQIDPNDSLLDFYQKVKVNTLDCYNHQMYPFDHLVEELNLYRDQSRTPIFDILLDFHNTSEKVKYFELGKEESGLITDLGRLNVKYDLEVHFSETNNCIAILLDFNEDVYEKSMVEGLLRHYCKLIEEFIYNPNQLIGKIDFLSIEEKNVLVKGFNKTDAQLLTGTSVIDLFENQVSLNPDNYALVLKDKNLTYKELDEISNQLANCLIKEYAVKPNDFVAVKLDKGESAIITILGILKAGATFVPIDPEYPVARKQHILSESNLKLLITDTNYLFDEEIFEGIIFAIDAEFDKDNYSSNRVNKIENTSNLAYVIYTSGSTGKPKGVMIEHHSLLNYLEWAKSNYSNKGSLPLNFGLITSLSFDLTITSLFLPFISGGHLKLFDQTNDIQALLTSYFQSDLNCIKLTPAHVSILSDLTIDQFNIQVAIIGGEALNLSQVEILRQLNPKVQIYNEYGPTESTVGCIVKRIEANERDILIGKPISNTQIFILDSQLQIVPIGVSGEICIGGGGLARGYLNQRDLTNEKFVLNPIESSSLIYKTGDLARWLADGNIEYLGRKDDQVKIRGYRIELEEIIGCFEQNSAIEQVVVFPIENELGEKELVACYISKVTLSKIDLRNYLKNFLPDYMIPTHFIQLEEFPLTSNGKIDKQKLINIESNNFSNEEEYVAPRNETEAKLVDIWELVLNKKPIGVKDDFFVLGGHSLKAVRLSNEYQKVFDVKLSVSDLFRATKLEEQGELIQKSTFSKFIQIPALNQDNKGSNGVAYRISDAQRRLWVLSQFEDGAVVYNTPGSISLKDNLNIEFFRKAIELTIDRHEILRTVFKEDEHGEVKQFVLDRQDLDFKIDYLDFRTNEDSEIELNKYKEKQGQIPFDLATGPLLSTTLLQTADETFTFYFNMHHIICDAWSLEVMANDVFSFYESLIKEDKIIVPPLRIHYKDYSAWQLDQLEEPSFQSHRDYWMNHLSGELPLLNLPTNKQRPPLKTHAGIALSTLIDEELVRKLEQYSTSKGGTMFMTLMASWNILIYRYTAHTDSIIGTPVAGRNHPDLENQIGFYLNTLALRNVVDPQFTFDQFYEVVRENILAGYEHQGYPFDRLVEDLNLKKDTSRNAIFDLMLTFQKSGEKNDQFVASTLNLSENKEGKIVNHGTTSSRFDLGINFQEIGTELLFHVIYNPDVYEQDLMENLMLHYIQLIKVVLDNPSVKISKLDFLNPQEKKQLLVSFNPEKSSAPADKTIVDLFEAQVLASPSAHALVYESIELSYLELNERANQLARYLINEYAISPDDIIGFQLDRNEHLVVVILAILKSGGAYLPIDKDAPKDNVDYVATDSGCKLIIDRQKLEHFLAESKTNDKENLGTKLSPNNLVYTIYTSGSTGKPKGVLIEHRSLVLHIHNIKNLYGVTSKSRFLQFFNIAFDAAAQEIFTSLCFGATLYIKTNEVDPEYLYDLISRHKITHADFSTAFFNSFIAAKDARKTDHQLEFCAIGGEKLEKGVLEKLWGDIASFTKSFYNVYGPTETTLTATYYPIIVAGKLNELGDSIPIGKSHVGRQLLILDEFENLVPIGVVGEICIGGDSVARGYLNRDELTANKFIQNPFNPEGRLYKTGDLGKWLPDGNTVFIGRKDDQVKIRGYRIELGEVEYALSKINAIDQVVVLAKSNENKVKYLTAYLTSKYPLNSNDLRSDLKAVLPEYMIPTYFTQLPELPLTPNGKVDKKALSQLQGLEIDSGIQFIAPTTPQEIELTSVWSAVLKRENIGVNDNFYNLGGDSIKSIQVVARLKQRGLTLKVEDILRTPVLGELALLVKRNTKLIDQKEVTGEVELTPIQHWFFKSDEISVKHHFNQSVVLESKERIDTAILEKSLAALTKHHDALRMRYELVSDSWRQINDANTENQYELTFHDLSELADPTVKIFEIGETLQSSISLLNGPLFKVAHFKLMSGDRIGLIIHHLVVDGVSWRILLDDLSHLYTSFNAGETPHLPLKTDSFQSWALSQKNYAKTGRLEEQRAYWESISNQNISPLPKDLEASIAKASIDSSVSFSLDKNTTELLQTQVHHVHKTEINDLLLTGFASALKEVLNVDKVLLKMEGHGREEILENVDISRTVGWFTSVYPFVLDISKSEEDVERLVYVKEALRKIPFKGIGYGILKYLSENGFAEEVTPEITFNYLGDFGANVGDSENAVFTYATEKIGADISAQNQNNTDLDIAGLLANGELSLHINYSSTRYHKDTMDKLIQSYEKNLGTLIHKLANSNETYLSPSDLTFKGLTWSELNTLNINHNLEDVYELSPLQESIYFHWLSDSSSSLYFEQASYRARVSNLEVSKLENAYKKLINRHSILRTNITNDFGGKSLQIVKKEAFADFSYDKRYGLSNKDEYIAEFILTDRNKGFNLESGSLMRLHLIELDKDEYEFVWSYHHILMDGWCMRVLINDFNELLNAEIKNVVPQLAQPIPYSNYINWLSKVDKEKTLKYWKDYLSEYNQSTEIPFKSNTYKSEYSENSVNIRIETEEFQRISELCNDINITFNTFVQVTWGYLLAQYNNTSDVVFGAVVSGRPAELPGVEEMIGLFINTVPVRIKFGPNTSPVDLLLQIHRESIESTAHHYTNLSQVQGQSELGKNLINHIIVFENFAMKEMTDDGLFNEESKEGISIESIQIFEQTNYDLNLMVHKTEDTLTINFKYNQNYYDNTLMGRIENHFRAVIKAFLDHPKQPLNI